MQEVRNKFALFVECGSQPLAGLIRDTYAQPLDPIKNLQLRVLILCCEVGCDTSSALAELNRFDVNMTVEEGHRVLDAFWRRLLAPKLTQRTPRMPMSTFRASTQSAAIVLRAMHQPLVYAAPSVGHSIGMAKGVLNLIDLLI